MLQLAMALSLNEQQQRTGSQEAPQPPQQPPAPMPRASTTSSTLKQLPNKIKRKSSSKELDEAKMILIETAPLLPITFPTASYLLNANIKVFQLRKILLEKFSQQIEAKVLEGYFDQHSQFKEASSHNESKGIKLIAFFQCLLNLMSDLSPNEEADKRLLDNIIHSLLNILKPVKELANTISHQNDSEKLNALFAEHKKNATPIYVRTDAHELQLVIFEFLFKSKL